MIQNPPTYSVASTNGPGMRLGPPPVASTVIAVDGGYRPPAVTNAPDPAHGISESRHRPSTDVLAALLGPARARLVLHLQQPLSTSECAQLTGVATSTASHHLTVPRDAGLVDSRRDGARVLHTRTPLGEALASGN